MLGRYLFIVLFLGNIRANFNVEMFYYIEHESLDNEIDGFRMGEENPEVIEQRSIGDASLGLRELGGMRCIILSRDRETLFKCKNNNVYI